MVGISHAELFLSPFAHLHNFFGAFFFSCCSEAIFVYRAFAGLISLEPTPPLRSSTELITHGEREENLHLPRERERITADV